MQIAEARAAGTSVGCPRRRTRPTCGGKSRMVEEAEGAGTTRRDALKKVAAGTVAVWAAPAVLSVSRAAAAGSGPGGGPEGGPICGDCSKQVICGQDPNSIDGECYGVPTCSCFHNVFCAGLAACSKQADCPSGFVC